MFEFATAIFIIFVGVLFAAAQAARARSRLSPDELDYGPRAPELTCPSCGAMNRIHARPFVQAGEFSRWKLTAAALTGGLSLLAVGLRKRSTRRKARCAACSAMWIV